MLLYCNPLDWIMFVIKLLSFILLYILNNDNDNDNDRDNDNG